MTYFLSDLHLGHQNVIGYADRPFLSIEEMNQYIIDSFNSVVSSTDQVYIVGDLCLGGIERAKEYLTQLNGIKILIRGNHDRGTDEELLAAGYTEVHNKLILNINDIKLGLSHYSFRSKGEMPGKFDLLPNECDILIHGHSHSKDITQKHSSGKLMINVGCEALSYKPMSIDEVFRMIKSQR